MTPTAVLLLAVAMLLIGFFLGRGTALAPPAPAEAPPVAAAWSATPPLTAGPAYLAEVFAPPAQAAARALEGGHVQDAPRLLASLMADGWVRGATDLRAALVTGSGLPPEVVENATRAALLRLEA